MVRGQDDVHLVAEQVVAVDAVREPHRLVLPLVAEHEVEVAEGERRQRLLGLGLEHLAAQARRVARQRLDGRERDAQQHRLEACDAPAAGDRPRGSREVGLGDRRAFEQCLGVADEHERRIGEPHAPPRPLEQRDARFALEHGELLGDRRGRELERVGDRGDRSALAQLAQETQAAQIEHREETLLHSQRKPEWFLTLSAISMSGHEHTGDGDDQRDGREDGRGGALPRLRGRRSARWASSAGSPTRTGRPSARCWPFASYWPLRCSGRWWSRAALPLSCAGSAAATWSSALALGGGIYAAQAGGYFAALERVDPSLLALLLYTFPAIVAVAAIALGRERADRRRMAALGLVSGGLVLVLASSGAASGDPLGAALGLATAVVYSVYILAGEGIARRVPPLVLSALVCTAAAVSLTAGSALLGELRPGRLTLSGWAWIACIAVVCTVVALSLFFAGLRRVGPTTASILSTVEPVVTVALAFVAFGDVLGVAQLLGGFVVLAGVLVLQAPTRTASQREAAALAYRAGRAVAAPGAVARRRWRARRLERPQRRA